MYSKDNNFKLVIYAECIVQIRNSQAYSIVETNTVKSLRAEEFETIYGSRITWIICCHGDVMVYYRTTASLPFSISGPK